jgi:hypothetical protein
VGHAVVAIGADDGVYVDHRQAAPAAARQQGRHGGSDLARRRHEPGPLEEVVLQVDEDQRGLHA